MKDPKYYVTVNDEIVITKNHQTELPCPQIQPQYTEKNYLERVVIRSTYHKDKIRPKSIFTHADFGTVLPTQHSSIYEPIHSKSMPRNVHSTLEHYSPFRNRNLDKLSSLQEPTSKINRAQRIKYEESRGSQLLS